MSQELTQRLAPYVRFYSSVCAPLALFGLAIAIIDSGRGWTTPADAAFLGVLGVMLVGRRCGSAGRRDPDPASSSRVPSDFLQTSAGTFVLCVAVWCVANVIGNYLLRG